MSDTCSGFLYTLWLNHHEIDFSFFGDKAVEKVKQYTNEAAQNAKTSTLPDPSEVAQPTTHAKVSPTEAAEVLLIEAAEVQPTKLVEVQPTGVTTSLS